MKDDDEVEAQARHVDAVTAEVMKLVQDKMATPSLGILVLANAAAQTALNNGRDIDWLMEALATSYELLDQARQRKAEAN